jgi:hypothetical protein
MTGKKPTESFQVTVPPPLGIASETIANPPHEHPGQRPRRLALQHRFWAACF